jgi:hypothetical protein
VSIELNHQSYQDKSSFMQRGTFISAVLPKRYRLVVSKDDYQPYEKNITVLPGQVTRVLHAFMVPLHIASTTYTHIPGDIIVDQANGTQLLTYDTAKKNYYSVSLATPIKVANLSQKIASLTRRTIVAMSFYPHENDRLVAQTQAGLSTIDLATNTITPIVSSTAIAWWGIRSNNLYAITATATPAAKTETPLATTAVVSVFDLSLAKIAQTFTLTLPTSSEIVQADFSSSHAAIVLADGSLLIYPLATSDTFTRIADAVQSALFSPDGSRMLYRDKDGKIFAYLFSDDIVALNTPANTALRVNIMETARVSQLWWALDQYHILCAYPDKITIAEITQSEPNQQYTIAPNGKDAQYDDASKILLVMASSTVTAYNINF